GGQLTEADEALDAGEAIDADERHGRRVRKDPACAALRGAYTALCRARPFGSADEIERANQQQLIEQNVLEPEHEFATLDDGAIEASEVAADLANVRSSPIGEKSRARFVPRVAVNARRGSFVQHVAGDRHSAVDERRERVAGG